MGKKPTKFDEGIVVKTSTTAPSAEGEIRNKDSKLQTYIDGAERDIVTNDQTQTLENKTIDGTSATGNNTVTTDADQVTYDNTTSGLTATNSQDAIDEVEARLDTAESNITTNTSNLSNHLADATDAHDASAISNIPSGNLASTDVQSALNELQTDVDTRALDVDLTAHISDTVDAHDASAISNVPSGNLVATDVQTALNELQTDVDTRALDADLDAHVNNTTGAHEATAISYDNTTSGLLATNVKTAIDEVDASIEVVASDLASLGDTVVDHIDETTGAHASSAISYNNATSGLTAVNVQTAIDEVEGRLDTAESNITTNASDLSDHEALTTGIHGVTGTVVGTTDTQTLTNKTLSGASIENTTKLTSKEDTLANLETYAATADNGEYLYATDTKDYYGVEDGVLVPLGGGAGGGSATTWGTVNPDTKTVDDFTTTGTASVSVNSGSTYIGGLDGSSSFAVDLPAASDSAEIEVEMPYRAIDVRYNKTTLSYLNYGGDEVLFEILDFDGNVAFSQSLSKTGEGLPFISQARFKTVSFDWTVPFSHGNLDRNCKFRFTSENGNSANTFFVDFIQSDSNPRAIGQYVEVNRIYAAGCTATAFTQNVTPIPFNQINSDSGWTGSRYYPQKAGSDLRFDGMISYNTSAAINFGLFKNGTYYKAISQTSVTSNSKKFSFDISADEHSGSVDYFEILSIGGNATTTNSTEVHYLNITETANRRSIMSEVDRVPDIVTAKVTPTDIITGENYEGFITGVSRSGSTITINFQEQNEPPTFQATLAQNASGGLIQPENVSITTTSIVFDQRNSTNAPVSLDYSWNVAICRSAKDIGNLKQSIAITLDEIIADGNEYPVFGKFITVGGVKYQVYRRAWNATGAGILATLSTTLKPLNQIRESGDNKYIVYTSNGTSNCSLIYNASSGNVSITESGFALRNVQHIDYYDTARPLN